jgi:SAM-dependent methyltransferase
VAEKQPEFETRTIQQLREHYEIEKELASRLYNASREERRVLYSSLYDVLFQRVPLHPQLTQKVSPEKHIRMLKHFLNEDVTFLEIGPGDCALSFGVAGFVRRVYAVDVSKEITKSSTTPGNFHLVLSDGCSIPVPKESINVAYSNQLMEHLHPDDALEQLHNIFTALAPSGIYLCITPNRLNGPHDISMYFDDVATGFHLREYTITELSKLFKAVGFSKVNVYFSKWGIFLMLPIAPFTLIERVLSTLPHKFAKRLSRNKFMGWLLYIRMIATK